MSGTKKWLLASAAVIATTAVATLLFVTPKGQSPQQASHPRGESRADPVAPLPGRHEESGTPADVPPLPNFVTPGEAGEPDGPLTAPQIAQVMQDWQKAVVARNAEIVEKLDNQFRNRPEEFLPALIDCALVNTVPQVRAFCTRVLGNLRRPEAIPGLHKMVSDRHEYVRLNAAWALGELKDQSALPLLTKMARSDSSPSVRGAANEALGRVGRK